MTFHVVDPPPRPELDRLAYAQADRARRGGRPAPGRRPARRRLPPGRRSAAAAVPAASASPAPASRPTSARRSPARSTRPAPAPTSSTPPAPCTATSAWSIPTTSSWSCRTAARARRSSGCCRSLRQLAAALIALTGNGAEHAGPAGAMWPSCSGPLEEVCPLGLAPSTSTTAMIAVGDALAFVLSRMREFTREDFARFHPAGSLGRKLLKVEAVMRHGRRAARRRGRRDGARGVRPGPRRGRRTGAVMLIDDARPAVRPVHRQRPGPAVRAAPRRRPRSADRAR